MTMLKRGLSQLARNVKQSPRDLEKVLVNQGRMLAAANAGRQITRLSEAEFQCFSQWGEDGIIQYLIGQMPGIPCTFIEFGVEDFTESNCRFLMMKDNWSGHIIDGSPAHVATIRQSHWFWKHDLGVTCAFIDKDNINGLLDGAGFGRAPGILSVDIDGVDWWVLQALEDWRPWMVIVEYNGLYGSERAVTVPYDPAFVRHRKHHSGLYWGASLKAFDDLLEARGYVLAGTNSQGSNAFFVLADKAAASLTRPTLQEACGPVTFRDVRDEQGQLRFIPQQERLDVIADQPLVDTASGATITVRDLGLGARAG